MHIRIAAIILLAIVVAGCGSETANVYGGELFSITCAHCHGSDLGGGVGPPLGAGSNAASLTDEQIAGVIRVGPGAMPSFDRTLSDEQITSLVTYVRSRQSP